MLRHLELHDKADRIQDAILNTIAEGKFRTADLGGKSSTTDFTRAICDHLWKEDVAYVISSYFVTPFGAFIFNTFPVFLEEKQDYTADILDE